MSAIYFSASKCLNFFKSLGYKIAKQSILYIEKYSQESYLFFFIPIYSYGLKDRVQYPRKAYAGDTGFIYAITGKTELGRFFENCVLLELKRRGNQNVYYWKKKHEIDFLITDGLKPKEIIQVTYDISDKKTEEREIKGAIECGKEFKIKKATIITKDVEATKTIENIIIQYIPLWKWLLKG